MAKQADPAESQSDLKYTIVGEQEHGKTVLALAFARHAIGNKKKIWLWNTDGRGKEYSSALGHANILIPATPNLLDVRSVRDEVQEDVAKGVFNSVGLLIMDNATHTYQMTSMETMADKREGDKGASHIDKATAMAFLRNTMLMPGKDFLILAHIYKGGDNVGQMKFRQSLSDLEMSRLVMVTNAKLGVVREGDRFGVCVVWFRYRKIEPFTLWDEPGGMFQSMPDRIKEALYSGITTGDWSPGVPPNLAQALKLQAQTQKNQVKSTSAPPAPVAPKPASAPPAPPPPIAPPAPSLNGNGGGDNGVGGDKKTVKTSNFSVTLDKPVKHELLGYGVNKSFPTPEDAKRMALAYFQQVDEVKIYPFGDPTTKEAADMCAAAYDQIKNGTMPGYVKPTTSKEMAQRWVAYVKYLAKLAQDDYITLKQAATVPEETDF